MSSQYFNHNLLNIFIGLSKGSLLLYPYSKKFKEFSYEIFSIEKTFNNINNIKPECTLCSSKLKNTLLFEWTRANYETKKSQLDRYSKTTSEKLYENLIPLDAAKTFDYFYIVCSEHVNEFIHIDNPMFSFFEMTDNNTLKPILNRLSASKVQSFFDSDINFSRIPRFIPIDFERPNHDDLKTKIVAIFVKQIVKSDTKTIYASSIAKAVMSESLWKVLGKDKQTQMIRIVYDIISQITLKPQLKDSFIGKKVAKIDTKWDVKIKEQQEKVKIAKKIHTLIQQEHSKQGVFVFPDAD